MVYVEVKHHERIRKKNGRVQNCVKVEVAVLGSPSLLIVLLVSVDVNQQWS